MSKKFLIGLPLAMVASAFFVNVAFAKDHTLSAGNPDRITPDSAASRAEVIKIINTVIKASGSFDLNAVADLYTPNAMVADEEPPFSWNGETAGVQWVSTVEKTCKSVKLKEFKGKIGRVTVYLQTDESIYVVVPVDYTGEIKGERFEEDGAFTFVFRLVSGRWLIKSQVWIAKRAL